MMNTINPQHISFLLDEMKNHPKIKYLNVSEFYGILFDRTKSSPLVNVVVSNPENFADDLKELDLKVSDEASNNKFSIAMLLRHTNIGNYIITKSQSEIDKKGMKTGVFPYHSIIGDLTFSSDIVDMMKNSSVPYSLLGKLEKIDILSERYIMKQKIPILITFGADYDVLARWENKNTITIKEPDTVFFKNTHVHINNKLFNF